MCVGFGVCLGGGCVYVCGVFLCVVGVFMCVGCVVCVCVCGCV